MSSHTLEIGSYDGGFIDKRLVRLHSICTRTGKNGLEHLVAFAADSKLPLATKDDFEEAIANRLFKGRMFRAPMVPQVLLVNGSKEISWAIPESQMFETMIHWKSESAMKNPYEASQAVRYVRIQMCPSDDGFWIQVSTKTGEGSSLYHVVSGVEDASWSRPSFPLPTNPVGPFIVDGRLQYIASREPNSFSSELEYHDFVAPHFMGRGRFEPSYRHSLSIAKTSLTGKSVLSQRYLLKEKAALIFTYDLSQSVCLTDKESTISKRTPIGSKKLGAFAGAYAWDKKDAFYFSPTGLAWPALYRFDSSGGVSELPVEPFYDVQALHFNDGGLTIGAYDEGRRKYVIERRTDLQYRPLSDMNILSAGLRSWLNADLLPFLRR